MVLGWLHCWKTYTSPTNFLSWKR